MYSFMIDWATVVMVHPLTDLLLYWEWMSGFWGIWWELCGSMIHNALFLASSGTLWPPSCALTQCICGSNAPVYSCMLLLLLLMLVLRGNMVTPMVCDAQVPFPFSPMISPMGSVLINGFLSLEDKRVSCWALEARRPAWYSGLIRISAQFCLWTLNWCNYGWSVE